jgi:O-acetyl-ADP-ribose deacetylase (regulator of RNase III)
MSITRGTGNLLTQDVDALVNTVNTEGIMGKGIALQFKKAWPAMLRTTRQPAGGVRSRSVACTYGRLDL